jgi:hypothetical protein
MLISNHVRPTRREPSIVLAAAALLFAAVGCASEPKPRPTSLDPSSPAAPESPPLVLAALSPSAGKGGVGGTQPAIIYTCPMHPEITSNKPGNCPICGMKLVPKAAGDGKK